jgi:hypothetical protein
MGSVGDLTQRNYPTVLIYPPAAQRDYFCVSTRKSCMAEYMNKINPRNARLTRNARYTVWEEYRESGQSRKM